MSDFHGRLLPLVEEVFPLFSHFYFILDKFEKKSRHYWQTKFARCDKNVKP